MEHIMKTILVVDPDSAGVGELLNRSGFSSMVSTDAGSALAKVRSGMPLDLVITELRLPDMDGIDFLNIMRIARPGLPVLVLTASGSLESYLLALQLGVIDYVNKPIRDGELHHIVNRVFERHGLNDRAVPPDAA
jgi:DNA-binding NtrC family response regulator